MKAKSDLPLGLIFLIEISLLMASCSPAATPMGENEQNTPSPTPTSVPMITPTSTPTPMLLGNSTPEITLTTNRCEGISGMLEMQILVGPAAAVGGEPYSVGKIPFTVSDQDPYTMQGKTHLSYNTTLDYSWGTYTVTLEMDADLTGQCVVGEGGNSLNMEVKLSGEQNLVVVVHLKQTTYPWKGSSTLQLTFPIQEGATAKGEGWIFVLHINES